MLGALSVTLALAAIASQSVDAYGSYIAPALSVSSLTRNLAWVIVAVLGLLVVLNGRGLSITPMLTALGVGGLAVALALQEPLANFFAGLSSPRWPAKSASSSPRQRAPRWVLSLKRLHFEPNNRL